MALLYVSQKSLLSERKGVKPYAKPKRPPPHLQGVLEVSKPFRRTTEYIPSKVNTGASYCSRNPDKVYTGSNIIGIGTMHKSNAVPIFNDNEAKDIASMRRN